MYTISFFLLALGASMCSALPAHVARQSRFAYYDLITPLASPCDLTTGPDGAIWGDTFTANKVLRVDPSTGTLEEIDIPYTLGPLENDILPSDAQGRVALACVVQPGKDGNIYAATGVRNQFVRVNPQTRKVDIFNTGNPLGNLQPFNDAWPGDTGMFFSQTTGNVISLFDYNTEQIQDFQVPTPAAGPLGMIVASDDALWFTEFFAGKLGRLNATDGTIEEYALPASLADPTVMRAETESRYIWFTCLATNAIGRFDIISKEATAFPNTSPASAPTENTVDDEGNIWFSTSTQNTLNYLTPSTGEFTTIEQPDTIITIPVSIPPAVDIAMHYDQGTDSMWFTELAKNRVGQYQLD